MGDFSKLESVQQHLQRAMEYTVSHVNESFAGTLQEADREAESPIEAIFALWWHALYLEDVFRIRSLELSPQFPTKPVNGRSYRLDFAVTPKDTDFWHEGTVLGARFDVVGIEMDGHDFHERTKEQVAQRNQRDRDLNANGFQIVHFSGSEIYKNPAAVLHEAVRIASDHLNAFEREVRKRKRARGDYGPEPDYSFLHDSK